MSAPTSLMPLWSTAELGRFLSVPVRTLRGWRALGVGPGWLRIGRTIRYDPVEVRRWLSEECSWHKPTFTSWSPNSTGGGGGSRAGERRESVVGAGSRHGLSSRALDAPVEPVTISDRRGGGADPMSSGVLRR
jgi:hypothetical protein